MCRAAAYVAIKCALPILAVGLFASAVGAADAVEPYYWRQRVFFVPYQPNAADPQAAKIDKVQLLVSRDGGRQWALLQEADAQVRGFSYHAAADGEYAFALRMSDRRGNTWPKQIAQPLLRVVVDTQAPKIDLAATVDAMGRVLIRYEATDQKLRSQSLQIEAQLDGSAWERLPLDPPEVAQADRLMGKVTWRPPSTGSQLQIRAAIEDAAGNPSTAAADATLLGPLLDPNSGPQLSSPSGETPWNTSVDSTPALPPAARPPIDWPVGPSIGASTPNDPYAPPTSTNADEPPLSLPYAGAPAPAGASGRPTHFASDAGAPPLLSANDQSGRTDAVQAEAAWTTSAAPNASTASPAWSENAATPPLATAATQSDGATPRVNSVTFDLDYELQTVGPWGVSQVNLWGTRDGGRTWQRLGPDQDNRSPMRVSVPDAGTYGFRIVVDGGNGVAAPTPQPGDAPELIVSVDLTAPRAELKAPQLGQGAFAGQALIAWSADDEHLAERPIALFFGAAADGPWSTIATNLENVGHYAWQPPREAPPQVFIRLEVRDGAGNVAVQQTPTAVDLHLPRPTGRLRQVRPAPVAPSDPSRYRTAAAPGPHPLTQD